MLFVRFTVAGVASTWTLQSYIFLFCIKQKELFILYFFNW